ncbi:MAG TPA: glycosyltransferase family 4 protein [Steroidobacteraceae bacterium]|nr:glycosyltransferase family 4 protein [Steroidobacteraceae bacterium]
MRILYHHRTQGEEPESIHIAAIVRSLRKLGHHVDIVGPARIHAAGGSSKKTFAGGVKRRMPRVLVELAQVAYNVVSLARLVRMLARTRYDFIYERHALYNMAGLLAARAFAVPLILEVNTLYADAWRKYYGLKFYFLARPMERHLVRKADAVITVTDAERVLLEQEGVNADRITVSHNAIDPADFDVERHQDSRVRQSMNLPPLIAGFVGTMNRWQAVEGFAAVVERVLAERSDVGFLFVGDGEGRPTLEAELQRRGVRNGAAFTGRQPHAAIPELIAAMDIGLLLDSNNYGSPMKVFEYWAMGKAVIAPAVPPVLEIMRDGETGLVIVPGDAAAMARCILRLAADSQLRVRLGDAGRRRVLSNHTWDQNAAKVVEAAAALRRKATPPVKEGAR